jgi:hypothetical protein
MPLEPQDADDTAQLSTLCTPEQAVMKKLQARIYMILALQAGQRSDGWRKQLRALYWELEDRIISGSISKQQSSSSCLQLTG